MKLYYFRNATLASLIFISICGYGQYKNEINYSYLGAFYFDKYPFKLNNVQDFLMYRICYTRHLGKKFKKGVLIEIGHNHNRYYSRKEKLFTVPENSYMEREAIYFGIGYNNTILDSKCFKLDGKIGIKYRYKSYNKLLVKNYPDNSESIIQFLEYNNTLGISFGIRCGFTVYKKWECVLDADISRYFNKNSIISQANGQKISDPQKNTLIIGIGLSYNLGK